MLHSAATPVALQEFIPPLGPQPANPVLYSPQPVTLLLKEKVLSLTGDGFTIVNAATSQPVVLLKPKKISLHSTKVFTDPAGVELFSLSHKTLALFKSFTAESKLSPAHNFEIKGKFALGGSKSSVHFKNASDGRDIELLVKGDWFDRSANITLNDRVVATVGRQFANARELVGGKQTYFVTVAPGVDLSMIAAICVCLDEKENEK
ncbi:unnamed protein product [Zymoseptoria tritici ST99CH_1A5]|uniref:DUF567 domain protein n=4 Tax=Zymoseptoria tritici TaxID=1047171 RepID=F9X1K5_ZYMTI|nr:uncharacterized protein MYCGRDRAFT_102961 [Zymoseptoria tritici IPO323]SMQ46935.1 unnamed protein product [Zymoseptoria tritici ST99CH_3D7]SMR43297.1 unnamed protein product [Zymoseptoria tritici ST99CH_1E4]SMR45459.1 unnamed protein product [Zymoseptoria tritici ST99CH_3D1]SMY20618.1 unnamed protein product [Zymoseptoria tritici ST99CH_1A5]EGP91871.1 hypothetical protein MYCGRDRAFT_102961 [Zymoseptoria tritici IPO323]